MDVDTQGGVFLARLAGWFLKMQFHRIGIDEGQHHMQGQIAVQPFLGALGLRRLQFTGGSFELSGTRGSVIDTTA